MTGRVTMLGLSPAILGLTLRGFCYPTESTRFQEIEHDYASNKRKLDTLTEIMRQLTDFPHLFHNAQPRFMAEFER